MIRFTNSPWTFTRDGLAAALGGLDWKTLEAVAVAVLDDVNNEVVPRWVQVAVSYENADAGERERHAVLIEDRQPGWDNPSLLARLPAHRTVAS